MTRTVRQQIGANLRNERERAGLSQADLGSKMTKYLGNTWTRQTVSVAEDGGRAFVPEELVALCLALEVSVFDLLSPVGLEQDKKVVELPGIKLTGRQYFRAVVGVDTERGAAERNLLRQIVADLREPLDETQAALDELRESVKYLEAGVGDGWELVT